MKKKNSYIGDEGYVKQSDIVGTVSITLSILFITILIVLGVLALITT